MSTNPKTDPVTSGGQPAERSFFEQQRDALLAEVGLSLEHVLQNMNKLNRNLEGVIAVGNEFGAVEALWSQFEHVMAKDADAEAVELQAEEGAEEEEGDSGIKHEGKT